MTGAVKIRGERQTKGIVAENTQNRYMYAKERNRLNETIAAFVKLCRKLRMLMKGEHVVYVEAEGNCIVRVTLTKLQNGVRTR